ncbi:ComEA family DNA-binding protein [Planctomicrobium sp. SH527]|uniref:ComEA family DNA-binding protein n=1 Tax=Planctomicrobium sp. SH527 TaxID=3448123 RepID=UPI003F5C1E73
MSEANVMTSKPPEDENLAIDSTEQEGITDSRSSTPSVGIEAETLDSPAENTGAEEAADVHWGLSSGDRRFLFVACSLILILVIANIIRLNWYSRDALVLVRPEENFQVYQIDINRANWVEWMQVPEIGQVLAMKVIADRDERGPFRSVDDVERVNGIGRKTLNKIRPHLIFRE